VSEDCTPSRAELKGLRRDASMAAQAFSAEHRRATETAARLVKMIPGAPEPDIEVSDHAVIRWM